MRGKNDLRPPESPSLTLNSMTLGPSTVQHQADVQETAEWMSFHRHSIDHRHDDFIPDSRLECFVDEARSEANAPMPPGCWDLDRGSKIRL